MVFGRSRLAGLSSDQLLGMRAAGLLTGRTLALLQERVRPGMSTLDLDRLAEEFIRDGGGVPNFQLVPGYSHTLCTSLNDEVVHGIPSGTRVLREGDLLSIDCGAQLDGWNGDSAVTLVVGGDEAASEEDRALSDATRESLWAGIAALAVGERLHAVGDAVEDSIVASSERLGHELGIIEEYVGHGIGSSMHMDPQIPNFRVREKGPRVVAGFCGAIEPMITWGSPATTVLADDWTVSTVDGSRAAHWEHSVAVTERGLWVLTALDGGRAELEARGAAYAPLADD